MGDVYVGIDLGGTNIKIGCFDSDLNILCKTSVPTEAEKGPSVTVEKIGVAVEEMLAEKGLSGGVSVTLKSLPDTFLTISVTCLTEYPLPLPRL